jgi:hypothetical protein
MATTVITYATDVWEGEHAVTWESTLKIEAAKFAEIKTGDKIVVEFKDATGEVIELHSNGGMLPGTRYAHFIYADQSNIEVFATPAMIASLKQYGMEICGTGFTATKVWYGDGKESIDENTVWSGFFWMDEWSTLEIAKTSFDGVDWSKYKAIRFISEAGRTDYVMKICTTWDEEDKIGDQSTMTTTNEYFELSLEGVDMATALASTDRLMIQCDKDGGEAFNFTQVQLIEKEETTGVNAATTITEKATGEKFDLLGRKIAQPVKGTLYIMDGKKYIAK